MVKVSTKAIDDIVGQDEDVQWTLTDSRRTPAGFLESLKGIPISTHAHQTTDSDWLPETASPSQRGLGHRG